MITLYNYCFNTVATFKGCKTPRRMPDYISKSGSEYWYGKDKNGNYVIRQSDHWCTVKIMHTITKTRETRKIASCNWHLVSNLDFYKYSYAKRTGKCYLHSFKTK